MPKPFAVRVLRLADETEQDMPYKSFLYIKDNIDDVTRQQKFELVGEIDAVGNLVPGSPNLVPEHQTVVISSRSAEPVVSVRENEQVTKIEVPAVKIVEPIKRRGRPAQVKLQETQA